MGENTWMPPRCPCCDRPMIIKIFKDGVDYCSETCAAKGLPAAPPDDDDSWPPPEGPMPDFD